MLSKPKIAKQDGVVYGPLAVQCPPGVTAASPTGQPVVVPSYPPSKITGGKLPYISSYTPPAGSAFPVGSSSVLHRVTSADAQAMNCSFPVIVTVASPTFDYYVSTTGNNSWNGLFPSFAGGINGPKRTFGGTQGGLALLQGGQVLAARGGFYDESLFNPTVASGLSDGNRTRIVAYPGETVWIKPTTAYPTIDGLDPTCWRFDGYKGTTWAWIEIDGINLDGSSPGFNYAGCLSQVGRAASPGQGDVRDIRWKNATFIGKDGWRALGCVFSGVSADTPDALKNTVGFRHEYINLDVSRGGMLNGPGFLEQGRFQHAFYTQGCELLIQGCNIHHFLGFGIHPHRGSGPSPFGMRFIGNDIHDAVQTNEANPGHVGIGSNGGALIYNNTIWKMTTPNNENALGIALGGIAGNMECYFNTIVQCGRFIENGFASNILRNNLGWQNVNNETIHNVAPSPGNASNNMPGTTNPQFANQAAGNLHLTGATPASIRTGGVAVAGITTDKDGVVRANPPSIGAYQP